MSSSLGGACRCSVPPYLSSMAFFLLSSCCSFLSLYSLFNNSSLVGSACKCTSAPFSYASHANAANKPHHELQMYKYYDHLAWDRRSACHEKLTESLPQVNNNQYISIICLHQKATNIKIYYPFTPI